MQRDSFIFAVSGIVFGVLVGWIIGTQQGAPATPIAAPATAAAPAGNAGSASAARPFDAARAAELERQAGAAPANAMVRAELANLYFDAERYDQAIPWYEAAYKLNSKDVSVSTDLAVAYYYTNQIDRALAQIDQSLAVDGKHLKTLLNQGIIRAFGKQDLAGAGESWKAVVAIAPDSEEGQRAQQGLDGLNAAHQGRAGAAATPPAAN